MSAEYAKLLQDLDKDDAYARIMAKERETLDTINLVVDHERRKHAQGRTIFTMTVPELLADFADNIVATIEGLMQARDVDDAVALFHDSRKAMYVGLLLMFVAVIALLLT